MKKSIQISSRTENNRFRLVAVKDEPVMKKSTLNQKMLEAGWYNDIALARTVLRKGADVNARDPTLSTALMWFAHYGNIEAVKLLIDNGADVNVVDRYGWTALMTACSRGHALVVEYLIGKHAVLKSYAKGWTLEGIASYFGNEEVLNILKSHTRE